MLLNSTVTTCQYSTNASSSHIMLTYSNARAAFYTHVYQSLTGPCPGRPSHRPVALWQPIIIRHDQSVA